MNKVLEFIKKYWAWFVKLISTKEWVLTFPAIGFAFVSIIVHSFVAYLFLLLWFITIIYNADE